MYRFTACIQSAASYDRTVCGPHYLLGRLLYTVSQCETLQDVDNE